MYNMYTHRDLVIYGKKDGCAHISATFIKMTNGLIHCMLHLISFYTDRKLTCLRKSGN